MWSRKKYQINKGTRKCCFEIKVNLTCSPEVSQINLKLQKNNHKIISLSGIKEKIIKESDKKEKKVILAAISFRIVKGK